MSKSPGNSPDFPAGRRRSGRQSLAAGKFGELKRKNWNKITIFMTLSRPRFKTFTKYPDSPYGKQGRFPYNFDVLPPGGVKKGVFVLAYSARLCGGLCALLRRRIFLLPLGRIFVFSGSRGSSGPGFPLTRAGSFADTALYLACCCLVVGF
jgi:hypothetical protein